MGGNGKTLIAAAAVLVAVGSALAWQKQPTRMPWREYPGQDNIEIPPDYQEQTEWVFARLMYPPFTGAGLTKRMESKPAGAESTTTKAG